MTQPLIESDQIESIKPEQVEGVGIGLRLVPTGSIVPFGGSTAPSGWLLCDGSAVSRTTYETLFDIIGETYGSGDGFSTFNLPDLTGRVPVGIGGTAFTPLGATPGSETHTLTSAELPSHNHAGSSVTINSGGSHIHTGSTNTTGSHTHGTNIKPETGSGSANTTDISSGNTILTDSAGSHSHTVTINSGGSHAHTGSVTIASVGSNTPHNNIQPSLTVNYIIAT